MKIMGKALLLALMSGVLTAVLLFVIDSSYAQRAVIRLVSLPGGLDTEEKGAEKEKDILEEKSVLGEKNASGKADVMEIKPDLAGSSTVPSVETGSKQIVSQTQNENGAAEDKNQDGNSSDSRNKSGGTSLNKGEKTKKAEKGEKTKKKTQDSEHKKAKADKGPAYQKVDRSYFSDAVFIGDSRTVGMQQSGLLEEAVYYAKVGIGIGGILNQRFIYDNGRMLKLEEALRTHSFGKVYIMIGINDMSAGDTEWFAEKYEELLDIVHNTQPEALVFIQGNIPMGYYVQDMTGSLNNINLKLRNETSRKLADNKRIFYLGVEEVYADANGNLNTYFSSDGLHVKSDYYPLWVDYLQHHGIDNA